MGGLGGGGGCVPFSWFCIQIALCRKKKTWGNAFFRKDTSLGLQSASFVKRMRPVVCLQAMLRPLQIPYLRLSVSFFARSNIINPECIALVCHGRPILHL